MIIVEHKPAEANNLIELIDSGVIEDFIQDESITDINYNGKDLLISLKRDKFTKAKKILSIVSGILFLGLASYIINKNRINNK